METLRTREELRSTLHERGMRMTPQRQLVLDALVELEHATPEQVCQRVRLTTPSVNITTIYRTLELLESLDLVHHTHLGHGAPSYSVHEHKHVHLVCHRCGRVDEVERTVMDEVSGTLRATHGFVLDASHLALSGTCRTCSQETP
ncbi:Transcriptional regulator, FUR family [Alloactinosynnema sp. L-07]|nr:Transcriptional regulator, FUR family [Alloactinosynnema sp. L-07]